jgi:hypothetical protein
VSTFQRRRDGRRLYEPPACHDASLAEGDAAVEAHMAEFEAGEAMRAHVAAWQAGECELKTGMHSASCLSSGDLACLCDGSEPVVFVQDPADRVDDGRECFDSWWSEAPR